MTEPNREIGVYNDWGKLREVVIGVLKGSTVDS